MTTMVKNKKNLFKLNPSPAPRPVFAGWSLTILPHVPCSLKAPGDHRCGPPTSPFSPSSLGFTRKYLLSVKVINEKSYFIVNHSSPAVEPRSMASESY